MVNIGLIGYGSMGSMIVNNILKLDLLLDDEKLFVSNHNLSKLETLGEIYSDVVITEDNKFLAGNCDVVIICVETPDFLGVLNEIKPNLKDGVHIVTSCAGLSFDEIMSVYEGSVSIVIPTLASTVGSEASNITSSNRRKGVSLFTHNNFVNDSEKSFIEDLFNEFSFVKTVDNPEDLRIATFLTSCSPAFLALLVDKLADISVNYSSFSKDDASYMIIKSLLGTSLILDEDFETDEIISKVATPGGITQAGLDYLDVELGEDGRELFETLLKRYE